METITHTFKKGDAVEIEELEYNQKEYILNKMLEDGCLEGEYISECSIYSYLYWAEKGTYFYWRDSDNLPNSLVEWNYLTWDDITKPLGNTSEGKEVATHFRNDLCSLYRVSDIVECWVNLRGWEAVANWKDLEGWLEELTPISEFPSEPLSDDLQEELPETLQSLGGLIKMSQDISEASLGTLNITLQGDGEIILHGGGFPCIMLTDFNPTEINKVLEVMNLLDGKFVEDE